MTQKDKRQVQKENRIVAVLLVMLLSSLIILSYAFSGSDTESGNSADSGNSGILSVFGGSGNFGSIFSSFSGTSSDAVIPTSEDIGKTVYVEGNVQSFRKTYTGDHLIITLLCSNGSDEELLSVFVKKSAGAENISAGISNGSRIGASGLVQEYNGSLEIVVSKESDVFIR